MQSLTFLSHLSYSLPFQTPSLLVEAFFIFTLSVFFPLSLDSKRDICLSLAYFS